MQSGYWKLSKRPSNTTFLFLVWRNEEKTNSWTKMPHKCRVNSNSIASLKLVKWSYKKDFASKNDVWVNYNM